MIIERMASELGLPISFIMSLSRTASHEYKTYAIPKRTGGTRVIHHPSRRLKALQRWLLARVIDDLPVHASAMAYRKGISILDNASVHASSRYLLRMDFLDFFPSITQSDLARYFGDRPALFAKWTPTDVEVVGKLVCRNAVLTIGAPTSPGLSNVLCYDLDSALQALSAKNNVRYTRYADDLFFSTDQPEILRGVEEQVVHVVADLKLPANLEINTAKTRHSSKRGARRVTGIVLGSDGRPYVGRNLKRKVRALVHKYQSLDEKQRASLRGLIAYAAGLDPQFMNALIAKYGLAVVRKARQR